MSVGACIVVTGAARGIGRAVAFRLGDGGNTILCVDQDAGALDETVAEGRRRGHAIEACRANVSDRADVDRIMQLATCDNRGLSALVNCVGITGNTGLPLHQVEDEDFNRVYRLNLLSAFLLTKAALPLMLAGGYGRILHLASIAGKEGNAGMTAYSATKAGLIGLVKSAAKDYAGSGITINALAPAVVLTDLVAAMPEEQVRYMTSRIPMGRTGTLDEVAAMAEFIVSPECGFTTGFTFDLSGGRATY